MKEKSAQSKSTTQEKKKFTVKNSTVIAICGLVLVAAVVGYANFRLTGGASSKSGDAKKAADEPVVDVFSAYRDERTTARAQEISYIDSVVTSAETDDATKTQAQQQKLALIANMESELTAEGILKTKLNTDAIVTVKDDAVNVVVNKKTLTDDEVQQIAEIIKTQTGQSAQNIKIMPQTGPAVGEDSKAE